MTAKPWAEADGRWAFFLCLSDVFEPVESHLFRVGVHDALADGAELSGVRQQAEVLLLDNLLCTLPWTLPQLLEDLT